MSASDFKVGAAAMLGFGSPAINWFLDNAEPLLKAVALLGQIGVAVVTILYIWRKYRNAKK